MTADQGQAEAGSRTPAPDHRDLLARCLVRLERQLAGDAGSWGDEVTELVADIGKALDT